MPRDRIEYNSGKLMPGHDPGSIPTIDMPPAEVVRRIEQANAWMVIKNVEDEPEYFGVLKAFVDAAQAAAGKRAGDYSDLQGFIFVSSANATTPFHLDAEENILIQIKGDKFVHIFDNRDCALDLGRGDGNFAVQAPQPALRAVLRRARAKSSR